MLTWPRWPDKKFFSCHPNVTGHWTGLSHHVHRPYNATPSISVLQMVNGYYTHSAILSSFHRRSYNLPSRPNIMLVHYLNAPAEGKEPPLPTLKNCDKRVWSKEELAQQIYPMCKCRVINSLVCCLNFLCCLLLFEKHVISCFIIKE